MLQKALHRNVFDVVEDKQLLLTLCAIDHSRYKYLSPTLQKDIDIIFAVICCSELDPKILVRILLNISLENVDVEILMYIARHLGTLFKHVYSSRTNPRIKVQNKMKEKFGSEIYYILKYVSPTMKGTILHYINEHKRMETLEQEIFITDIEAVLEMIMCENEYYYYEMYKIFPLRNKDVFIKWD